MAHNFLINTLGFHKLITDDFPYERVTAPFRKDQFDTTPTVGDQSLTGWWTRGQMSFHRGAGVNYYEVLDGEDAINRYSSSEGTWPWLPGELGLERRWNTSGTVTGTIQSGCLSSNGTLVVRADGTVAEVDAGGVVASKTVTPVVSLSFVTSTGDGTGIWATGSDGYIYKADSSRNFTQSVTPLAGRTFKRVWYAKERLWAVDNLGAWYTLTTSTAAAVAGDIFWASGITTSIGHSWTLAESPGSVYIGGTRKIYAITLDTSGAVPVVTSPIVAAILPAGEQIQHLGWELGKLLILTDKGVRIGEDRGGSFAYGGLVIEGSCHRSHGSHGNLAYVSVSAVGLCALNLTEFIDDLIPAYSLVRTGTLGVVPTSYYVGITAWTSSAVVWQYSRDRTSEPVTSTGTLTTGYHRLGTLEPKMFRSLRIKVGGSSGSIATSAVLSDGSTVSLGSVSAGNTSELSLSGITTAQEYIALRFTLTATGSSTVGPILLGYQLKALPMPKRQRLIRVPLMMFDTEQGALGRPIGAEKSAWTRLAALEALEESNALVTYTDKDTGETGTALIESIEMLRRNGSKGISRSNGFGGVVTVTLRKVA